GIRDWANVAEQILLGMCIALLHAVLLASVRWALGIAPKQSWSFVVSAYVSLNMPGNLLRYCLIAGLYHVIAYQRAIRERDVKEARMAQSLAEAKLANLEARLQPHFLFNALNTIAALIRKDPAAASSMVGQLSDLLRAALSAEVGREVTLSGELQLLDRYMAIQRTRFSDRLRFSVDASSDVLGAYVPQMILQPIVENAVRHGIGPRETAGAVDVHATRHGSMLRLVVRDDGVGFGNAPASLHGNGLGIRSTRARLAHLYGDDFAFDIRVINPAGTVVTIDVPFRTTALGVVQ
ncbi:MAG TPA: histidine kinase, partial [Gemmatimonadaceae bacterium]